jgi:hypothetical protein
MPTIRQDDRIVVKQLDVQNEFKIAGTVVTADATELNLLDGVTSSTAELNIVDGVTATAAEINIAADKEAQTLTDSGAITAKNGICLLNKAGVIAATLANPTATTDDFKRLSIRSLTAQAHTVTVTGGFGNGSTGEDVATFSGAIGDGIELMAYQGYWYITGVHQVSVA